MNKYKTLIVGLGNIGAGYDFDNDRVSTHVKAFSRRPEFDITVVDKDEELARRVSERYGTQVISASEIPSFSGFDCVSVCTPTTTHVELLLQAFKDEVPLVICEKPVASNAEDLNALLKAYRGGKTKVLVNYMRRYLPAMHRLKATIDEIRSEEQLTNLQINYIRGFVNNASHAWDLVEYLMGEPMNLSDYKVSNLEYDTFEHDPTLSLHAKWKEAQVAINGLKNLGFGCFEIDLFFFKHRIRLTNSADRVDVLGPSENNNMYNPLTNLKSWGIEGCVGDYMIPVIESAFLFLKGELVEDNFETSISLNNKMLSIISN